jgi:hypothetical protein
MKRGRGKVEISFYNAQDLIEFTICSSRGSDVSVNTATVQCTITRTVCAPETRQLAALG